MKSNCIRDLGVRVLKNSHVLLFIYDAYYRIKNGRVFKAEVNRREN